GEGRRAEPAEDRARGRGKKDDEDAVSEGRDLRDVERGGAENAGKAETDECCEKPDEDHSSHSFLMCCGAPVARPMKMWPPAKRRRRDGWNMRASLASGGSAPRPPKSQRSITPERSRASRNDDAPTTTRAVPSRPPWPARRTAAGAKPSPTAPP